MPSFRLTPTGDSDYGNAQTGTRGRFEGEAGLHDFHNRYYHAQLGRFRSRDPIGYRGSPWNLYEYVLGKPIDYVDPTGKVAPVGFWVLVRVCGPPCARYGPRVCRSVWQWVRRRPPIIPPIGPPGPEDDDDDECNPRNPSAGTIGWKRVDLSGDSHYNKIGPPPGDVPNPHIHVAKVNQSPYPECKCFWNSLADVIPGSSTAGMPNANQPVTGGGLAN